MLITVIIILAVGLVAWILFPEKVSALFDKKKSVKQPQQTLMSKAEMDANIRRLESELVRLKDENNKLRQQFDNLVYKYQENKTEYNNLLKRLHNGLVNLGNNQDMLKAEFDRKFEVLNRPKPQTHPQPPVPPKPMYPIRRYAKFPDPDCNGFRFDQLSDISSDSIYEITIISDNEAQFHLIPGQAVRSQLFSMLNHVVKPLCEISIESQSPENIVDVADGLLLKSGDCWLLKTKASIKLV